MIFLWPLLKGKLFFVIKTYQSSNADIGFLRRWVLPKYVSNFLVGSVRNSIKTLSIAIKQQPVWTAVSALSRIWYFLTSYFLLKSSPCLSQILTLLILLLLFFLHFFLIISCAISVSAWSEIYFVSCPTSFVILSVQYKFIFIKDFSLLFD